MRISLRPAAAGDGTTPRLAWRFGVYLAIALVVAGVVTFFIVRHIALQRAESNAAFHTGFVADSVLRDRLTPADFARPVNHPRLVELDRLFQHEILVGGALRVKLYTPSGLVTYSSEHAQIGSRDADAPAVGRRNRVVASLTRLNADGGGGPATQVLQAYAPVVLNGRTAGVLELYQDYGPIQAAARAMVLPIAGVIASMLLLLFVAFFPILNRATRRLRQQMGQIEHQAFHDALTGLPNRALFRDRVEHAMRLARRQASGLAVLMMDLDRFKEINDGLGHDQGDVLLNLATERLLHLVRESDTVARLGGDEFGLLAVGAADADAALVLADRVRRTLAEPYTIAGIELSVDVSIGIVVFPDHGTEVETLLRRADVAMYASKDSHAPAVYAAEYDEFSAERLGLAADLRRAVEGGQLRVLYQPQVDMVTRQVRGVEALVRWQHPQRGLLGPDQFIPLAEHTGLIRGLTTYVLETALAQVARWHADGHEVSVAVNVTSRDLLDLQLPDQVAAVLDRHGLPASCLELEITENTVLTDPRRSRAILDRIARLGVRIAIDDFGSGNSSLGYLKRLPIQVLKIDKSFVLDMLDDDDDEVIVRSTIDLGHNLGLRVVAEGVETDVAWQHLCALGCDTAQGFLLGRPVRAEDVPLAGTAGPEPGLLIGPAIDRWKSRHD